MTDGRAIDEARPIVDKHGSVLTDNTTMIVNSIPVGFSHSQGDNPGITKSPGTKK